MTRSRIPDAERRERLAVRQGLSPSHRFDSVETATRGMTALHATDQATIYASLWARVGGVSVSDIDRALYDDRSVVKQMAMRRTLFVVTREMVPAVLGSASARVSGQLRPRLVKELDAAGLAGERWLADAERQIAELLREGGELTAREIGDRLPDLVVRVRANVGKKYEGIVSFLPRVLTQLNVDGAIVRGTNDGHWRLSRPRWTAMDSWLGEQPTPDDPDSGFAALVGGWLRTFGPGTIDDIKWWLGGTVGIVRRALDDVGAVEVELDDGSTGWVHADDLDAEIDAGAATDWAALLPALDPTIMGWKQRDHVMDPAMVPDLFDNVGNAGNTAWWNGRVVGTWVQDDDAVVHIAPHPTADVSADVVDALSTRAEDLTDWLDGAVINTIWASPAMKRARAELTG